MKKSIKLITLFVLTTQFAIAQNVGIGIANPAYKLDVSGTIHGTSDLYVDGRIGIGTNSTPAYFFQVNDGSIAIYNTNDDKYWNLNYNAISNFFSVRENSTSWLVIANGGNVGIGNIAPSVKLDVTGSGKFSGDLNVIGDITSNTDGIVSSGDNSQQKIRTYTAPLTAVNLGIGASFTANLTISAGTFSGTPSAYVGNVINENGDYYKATLVLENVTATNVTVRVVNLSNAAISFTSASWKIIVIGPR